MGSLFIKNFKREPILNKEHFINTIIYIHRNPIHHGFFKYFTGWCYNSYCEIIELKSKMVEVEKIIKLFQSLEKFIEIHDKNLEKFKQSFELEAP
jgi:hypothetical protein